MAIVSNNYDDPILDLANDTEFAALTDSEKNAVAESFESNTEIRSAFFQNTRLSDSFAFSMASSLESNQSLTSLNLEGNLFTPEGVKALGRSLKSNAFLKELLIGAQQGIEVFDGDDLAKIFLDSLKENNSILKLKLKVKNPQLQEQIDLALQKNQKGD